MCVFKYIYVFVYIGGGGTWSLLRYSVTCPRFTQPPSSTDFSAVCCTARVRSAMPSLEISSRAEGGAISTKGAISPEGRNSPGEAPLPSRAPGIGVHG